MSKKVKTFTNEKTGGDIFVLDLCQHLRQKVESL